MIAVPGGARVWLATGHTHRGLAPDFWLSDHYAGQMGWAAREQQVCLGHYADLQIMPTSGGNLASAVVIAAL